MLICVYAAYRVVRIRRHLHQLRLGRDGERAVAQYLEWFRTAGFFIFHDVPNGDANVDHVLIGPKGAFTIETKTLSKPHRGECKITVVEGGGSRQRAYAGPGPDRAGQGAGYLATTVFW